MAEKKSSAIFDDPSVKEIYANKLVGTTFDGGTLSITMGVARVLPPIGAEVEREASPQVHVTARLALSPAAAVELTNNLGKMLSKLNQIAASRQAEQKPH